ncbi:hypothetical protein BGW39_011206 [Mortierella sp. 14UC]|nr:hypothetical protein BGW39_011206 [Mortierella sp. 14UC]
MDTTFNDLPAEVQEMVLAFLTQRDLSACVRVCRSWKTLFHPRLWRHIELCWKADDEDDKDDKDYEAEDDSGTWQKRVAEAMEASGHLVQSLKLKFDEKGGKLSSFLRHCSQSTFPNLTSAEVDFQFGEDDGSQDIDVGIATFINLSSAGWKRLVIQKSRKPHSFLPFWWESHKALLKHASTLVAIRMCCKLTISQETIDQLLCTAPNLKEAYFYGDGDIVRGARMDAREIEESKWVCDNLEVFGCRIGKILRPDITRNRYVNALRARGLAKQGSHEESIYFQQQVYAKLARLTKLRELTLGFPIITDETDDFEGYKYSYRQYDCLAMTVDSGLDMLKDLKDLRKVDLTNMEVYIDGEQEQAWFKKSWPNATIERLE